MKIFCCLILLFSSAASASVFKCVENGKTVYSATPCGDNARDISEQMSKSNLSSGNQPPDKPQSSSMALTIGGDGTYTVMGSVKGVPVSYQVDTGASMISVSKRITDQAGIFSCVRYIQLHTANGEVNSCIALVPEITFGVFRMANVEISIVPNMTQDALLGMGALRHFKINQQAGIMTISN